MTKHPCHACGKVDHPEAMTLHPQPVFLCAPCTELALVLILTARATPDQLQDVSARLEP